MLCFKCQLCMPWKGTIGKGNMWKGNTWKGSWARPSWRSSHHPWQVLSRMLQYTLQSTLAGIELLIWGQAYIQEGLRGVRIGRYKDTVQACMRCHKQLMPRPHSRQSFLHSHSTPSGFLQITVRLPKHDALLIALSSTTDCLQNSSNIVRSQSRGQPTCHKWSDSCSTRLVLAFQPRLRCIRCAPYSTNDCWVSVIAAR